MNSCTKPQYIKQPKSELAALAGADGVGLERSTLGIPFTPTGAPRDGIGGLRLQGT